MDCGSIHRLKGTFENSPAFQRRVGMITLFSPEGTTESVQFSRPFGTNALGTGNPALKRRAIAGCPFGTIAKI